MASVWADQLQHFLCFRDRFRVYNVLRHRSHLVQDVGCHLTSTKVSTSHKIRWLIIHHFKKHFKVYLVFSSFSCPFFYLFSTLSLTGFHLPCILLYCFFFIYYFPFSLPFYFCALSSVVSSLYLISTSNSPSTFFLVSSLLLLSSPCVCLVIRKVSWNSK